MTLIAGIWRLTHWAQSASHRVAQTGVKSGLYPLQTACLTAQHIEATGRWCVISPEIVLSGADEAMLLDPTYAGCSTAKTGVLSGAYLDKNQGALSGFHDQVNLAIGGAGPSGYAIIALNQCQPLLLQMMQGAFFTLVSGLLCCAQLESSNCVACCRRRGG